MSFLQNRRRPTRVSSENGELPEGVQNKIISVNERVLKECHELYMEPDIGLVATAEGLGVDLAVPRKKITILLLGNHSAGKSTFINWYIEEHVQKTGVAIETQGFTLVTSGRKRESLKGLASLRLYPHLKPLTELQGVLEYTGTEISPSKAKHFPLLTFIDTPGLVDGEMAYTYDVNSALIWLGGLADLIFVFFDPIGQALCRRTLDIVDKLSEQYADRMRFYLTKADEAGNEADRQRVLMQIVQELCKRRSLNRAGFDMPTIFIPDEAISKNSRCLNQIQGVVEEIDRCINFTVQNTLNSLDRDCDRLSDEIDKAIERDEGQRSVNTGARLRGVFLFGFFLLLISSLLIAVLLSVPHFRHLVASTSAGTELIQGAETIASPVLLLWDAFPNHRWYLAPFLLLSLILFFFISKCLSRTKPTLTRKERRLRLEQKTNLQERVKLAKQSLYKEYLEQSASDHDF